MNRSKEALPILHVTRLVDMPRDFTGIVIVRGGSKHWRLDGKRHREDGPAIESAEGHKQWYLNGFCRFDSRDFYLLRDNYIVLERGIPTNEMFGNLKLTEAKLLTANGTVFVHDNLPGLEIE
jgi:hypothetical protein